MDHYQGSARHKEQCSKAREILLSLTSNCDFCDKIFNIAGLSNHKKSCYLNPKNKKECKSCGSILKDTRNKFCNHSCAALVGNKNRKIIKSGNNSSCLNCKTEFMVKKNSTGDFCSVNCRCDYHYTNVTKPLIESGQYNGIGIKKLRRFVIERDGEICRDCNNGTLWNGKPITLQLDHINGNNKDNSPYNLRILCPNCHTQTPTYGNKNRN